MSGLGRLLEREPETAGVSPRLAMDRLLAGGLLDLLTGGLLERLLEAELAGLLDADLS